MNIEEVRSRLLAITIATVFSLIGWFGIADRNPTFLDAIPGVTIFASLFALPGTLFSVVLAGVFSPQGFHGADKFIGIALPINWITYFCLVEAASSKRKRRLAK